MDGRSLREYLENHPIPGVPAVNVVDERDMALQALYEIRGLLGFDNDGDPSFGAMLAGAGSVQEFVRQILRDVRDHLAENESDPM